MVEPALLLREIKAQYRLDWYGIHGVTHWARVFENARRISEHLDLNPDLLLLFSLFHDACRRNDGIDPGHGKRGARLAQAFRGSHYELDDGEFEVLYNACALHTRGKRRSGIVLQVCFDADRLDLARAGITPKLRFLHTQGAKDPAVIAWATERSLAGAAPPFIFEEWGQAPDPGMTSD